MMTTLTPLAIIAILAVVAFILAAFILAHFNICFTFMKEGTARAVMRGESRDHILMVWRGHRINDPRRGTFDNTKPIWEVLTCPNPDDLPSLYARHELLWRMLERLGIYWYGLWPFKKIYVYEFKWTEQKSGDQGQPVAFHRQEYTSFIFVKGFPYWVRLLAAEDKANESLNLDYLLTIHINNPEKALFKIDDWFGRVTADANNKGKIYVGNRSFNAIKKEQSATGRANMSQFAKDMCTLNRNLVTEPQSGGAQMSYGVTINGASLVEVQIAGSTTAEIEQALVARRVAELTAEATVATAKGTAKAKREVAKGEADAIETVYSQVNAFGELGPQLQLIDAIRQSSTSPGSTVLWANNPLGGLMDLFGRGKTPRTPRTAAPAKP